jgi:leucyl-tRNA synthetase
MAFFVMTLNLKPLFSRYYPTVYMDYNFSEIEKKWQAFWASQKSFAAEDNSSKTKYYVLDMFPYPSGAGLHVGHPLGYIASDIVSRYKRHRGFNVLHPMGYDSFGLPAEQYAIQTGQHPAITTEKNIKRYRQQLDAIGFSFDWSREVRTSNPDFHRWTQWIFLQLFDSWYDLDQQKARSIEELIRHFGQEGSKALNASQSEEMHFTSEEWEAYNEATQEQVLQNYRLAYRSESTVNWCPALGTVLANDEVKDGLSERGSHPVLQKKMMQWSMRITAYGDRLLEGLNHIDWSDSLKESQRNWIGKSQGASVHFELKEQSGVIEVFTTRPDTIFGASFMVLAPEHELVSKICSAEQADAIKEYQEQAARKSERDRMTEVKSISGVFTGAYAKHPFSGEDVPIWIADYVLAGYGTGAVMAVPAHDSRDWAFAKHFNLAIKEVVAGGNVEQESYDAKSGVLVNSDFLNGLEVQEAMAAAIEAIEARGLGEAKVNFRLRNAVFGRQRYWGEPIPIYFKNGLPRRVKLEHLPLNLPAVDKFLPTEDGEPPLARASEWNYDPEQGVVANGEGYPLETTTMPGWAGSSWYDLRYMDAGNTSEFASKDKMAYWQDVDLYIGGSEHATGHLLYTRFWHKFLKDKGHLQAEEPFKKLINQGMITSNMIYVWQVQYSEELAKHLTQECSDSNLLMAVGDTKPKALDIAAALESHFGRLPYPQDLVVDGKKPMLYVKRLRIDRAVIDELSREVLDFTALNQWLSNIYDLQNVGYLKGEADNFRAGIGELEKMSKSKYNVVNPDDIIAKYGADTLRMYEMFLGPLEQSKPWNTAGITGVHGFLKKLWKLYNRSGSFVLSDIKPNEKELKTLHTLIKKVNEDIQNFSFNTSISAFMIAVNELHELKCEKRLILEQIPILISPFAPHIAEEIWNRLGHVESISTRPFPDHEDKYLVESNHNYPISFNGKTRFTINLPADMPKDEVEKTVMADTRTAPYLDGKTPKKVIIVPRKIVNIVV